MYRILALVFLICTGCSSHLANNHSFLNNIFGEPVEVSILELNSNPDKYNASRVEISGCIEFSAEGIGICDDIFSENAQCLGVEFAHLLADIKAADYGFQYVKLSGKFRKEKIVQDFIERLPNGTILLRMGPFTNSLTNVRHIEFRDNPPRSCVR